jgi:phosphate transport system substrate-binding protein
MSRLSLLMLIGTLWASVPCAAADLKIYGSNTVGDELAPALVRGWLQAQGYDQISEQHEGTEHALTGSNAAGKTLEVELDARGSTTGFVALQAQKADIAMSSRPIKSTEVTALKSFGHCDTAACEAVVGLDGIAIIVNAKNPLSRLDKGALQRIFSGQVKDWGEIGGDKGAVHVYALDENSGTFDTFSHLVLGKSSLVGSAKRDASHSEISKRVAADVNAIGFVGLPFVHDSKALAVSDGEAQPITPSAFSVATEDYALSRRLFFYLPELSATELAHKFVEFAVSDAGQKVVEKTGFVSQAVLAEEVVIADSAPEEYRQLTKGAKRLSLNFRFLAGSAKLDNKAQRDLARLKAFMARPENSKRKRELMLFGFADSNESMPIVSLQLSMERADMVADLLLKEGMTPGKVRGYGNSVAVAANDSEAGRAKNRRVEVWIR